MPEWTEVRSEIAVLAKRTKNLAEPNPADTRKLVEKRVELRALKLEEHVRRVIAEAPPLTGEQLDRIAALLRAGGAA